MHLRGRQPMSVEHDSISLNLAVDGALHKLVQVIELSLERANSRLVNGLASTTGRVVTPDAWGAKSSVAAVHQVNE